MKSVLNGSFDTSQIATTPQHSIGYSMLTDTRFVNLPGGNGMPVALSKRADQMFIAEALDECKFDQANMSSFYEMQIAPITRAMTVPGNTSFTRESPEIVKMNLQLNATIRPLLQSTLCEEMTP